jgi:CheY-like chemotaxis protein
MKIHVMLVDDDKDELTFFLDALKDIPCEDGFKCTYAGSAKQAGEILKFLVPDFIFVDYKMPQTNGLQFLLTIKNQLGLEKPKVYLYSIFIDEKVKKAALGLGAAGVIEKKYTIKALSDELKTVLTSPVMPAYVFSGGE